MPIPCPHVDANGYGAYGRSVNGGSGSGPGGEGVGAGLPRPPADHLSRVASADILPAAVRRQGSTANVRGLHLDPERRLPVIGLWRRRRRTAEQQEPPHYSSRQQPNDSL